MNAAMQEYRRWIEKATEDVDVVTELRSMADNPEKVEAAFYRDLEFGTGGLRGVIGAGTNCMNIYTVAKASQGLADYIQKHFLPEEWQVAIGYDSRINSRLFAETAAGVFAGNGIAVFIFSELMPTPCLSFAVRTLGCVAGVMITASHNPAEYNGYKVYGVDGCQITIEIATEVLEEIEKLDIFKDVKKINFTTGVEEKMITYIPEQVYTAFVEEVRKQSVLYGDQTDKNISIIYSPLNGTGLKPVLRTLKESGFTNITVVPEQENPDGRFPTCPYPNPELQKTMDFGMDYASKHNADLFLATDPDCDRVGVAVKNDNKEYVLLSGNELGVLLLDYICNQRTKHNKMPNDPVMIKTIVTTDMAEQIAMKYGVRTINVLTGFKFICEQIGILELKGHKKSFIFGFEESNGFLSGTYVRDKDGVDAALLICEMCSFYKKKGISIFDKLNELYCEFGYYLNKQYSFTFEGVSGRNQIRQIMEKFRSGLNKIGSQKVECCVDYIEGINGLPKSDVLMYLLEGNCSIVLRPSGTEPKLKIYLSICDDKRESAKNLESQIISELKDLLCRYK